MSQIKTLKDDYNLLKTYIIWLIYSCIHVIISTMMRFWYCLQGHLPCVSWSVAAAVQPEQWTPLPGPARGKEDICPTWTHPGSHLRSRSHTRPAHYWQTEWYRHLLILHKPSQWPYFGTPTMPYVVYTYWWCPCNDCLYCHGLMIVVVWNLRETSRWIPN